MGTIERPQARRSGIHTGDVSPVHILKNDDSKNELTKSQMFELGRNLPGVDSTLKKFPWLNPLINKYFAHFADGAIDSLRVGSMVYQYAMKHADKFDQEQALLLAAAGITHDVGKITANKNAVNETAVYTNEEKIQKIGAHVEEGFNMVKNDNLTIALIIAGHHFYQDDRISYPPYDTPWLQTDDQFIHAARRILIVADRVDALKSKDRGYKKAYSDADVHRSLWAQGFQKDEAELVEFMLQKQYELAG